MTVFMVIWALVALLFGLASARSRSVVHLPVAVAAAFACAAVALGGGLVASLFLFLVIGLIGRWVVRPITRAEDRDDARVRPGTGSLVGRPAVVVERVSNPEAVGCVRIDDELWSARTPTDEDGAIENGERVHVVEVRGSTAIVSR